jgi:hypothetical protein
MKPPLYRLSYSAVLKVAAPLRFEPSRPSSKPGALPTRRRGKRLAPRAGFEPASSAWKAAALPLSYARMADGVSSAAPRNHMIWLNLRRACKPPTLPATLFLIGCGGSQPPLFAFQRHRPFALNTRDKPGDHESWSWVRPPRSLTGNAKALDQEATYRELFSLLRHDHELSTQPVADEPSCRGHAVRAHCAAVY